MATVKIIGPIIRRDIKVGNWITWGTKSMAYKVVSLSPITLELPGLYTEDGSAGYGDGTITFNEYHPATLCELIEDSEGSSGYPDDNPKTAIGLTKPGISYVPPISIFTQGAAMKDGKEKYGLMNWREHKVTSSVYYDAAMRHLMAWWDGEEKAEDSGVHHLGHALACLGIILDAQSAGMLNDDRPMAGFFPDFIKGHTANRIPV